MYLSKLYKNVSARVWCWGLTEGFAHAGLGPYHPAESSALKTLGVGNSKAWWHTAVVPCQVLGWSSLRSLSGLTQRTVLKRVEVLAVCPPALGLPPQEYGF